ncbi:MAG: hypothetical protein KA099_09040 [Alphaproteobacteria bacterium]|nr:hypothetical protein [Alphaproteobacteria bacterium]MBP7759178.1 hypothetical protein [Alphaproteobacteria bacterium]MBP7762624.1 hypothetical protein [Alphaproteobacteria bacterium]MBP7905456.1 hypothetical protein [Alphaproteobacteria bacterium]
MKGKTKTSQTRSAGKRIRTARAVKTSFFFDRVLGSGARIKPEKKQKAAIIFAKNSGLYKPNNPEIIKAMLILLSITLCLYIHTRKRRLS